jgi:hypothetical protein
MRSGKEYHQGYPACLYFAKAMVNRLWRILMGRGLVEPSDDLSDTNPATHPELLNLLAEDFVAHGYSLRHTLQQIVSSHAYARSSQLNGASAIDDRFYSRAYPRALQPEVLADAIADVTGVEDHYEGQNHGTRAVALLDPLTAAPSLDLLGRCSPASGCEESGPRGDALAAQLHLVNGELINHKLSDARGRLHELITAGKTDAEIVEQFYLRALSRRSTQAEQESWTRRLTQGDPNQRKERLEDFLWSLLNSRQFIENH